MAATNRPFDDRSRQMRVRLTEAEMRDLRVLAAIYAGGRPGSYVTAIVREHLRQRAPEIARNLTK